MQAAKVIVKALEDKTLTEVALHDLSARGLALSNSKKHQIDGQHREQILALVVEAPDVQEFPSVVIDARAIR